MDPPVVTCAYSPKPHIRVSLAECLQDRGILTLPCASGHSVWEPIPYLA